MGTEAEKYIQMRLCGLVQTKVKSWELMCLNNLGVWKADPSRSYDLVSVNR